MDLEYVVFLNSCIYDNIRFFNEKYKNDTNTNRLKGSMRGSLLCRDKNDKELQKLLELSRKCSSKAFKLQMNYWYYRSIELSVERIVRQISEQFSLPVLSAMLSIVVPFDIS